MLNKKGGQWSPLITYRNGLAGQDEEEEGMEKEEIKVNHHHHHHHFFKVSNLQAEHRHLLIGKTKSNEPQARK